MRWLLVWDLYQLIGVSAFPTCNTTQAHPHEDDSLSPREEASLSALDAIPDIVAPLRKCPCAKNKRVFKPAANFIPFVKQQCEGHIKNAFDITPFNFLPLHHEKPTFVLNTILFLNDAVYISFEKKHTELVKEKCGH